MTRVVVVVFGETELVSGESYCYRSHDAAWRQSRRVTTRPGVYALDKGDETYYLAEGDYWINSAGNQGQYHYGVGRKLVEVIDREGD